jgi:outer membrane immunogenic protein
MSIKRILLAAILSLGVSHAAFADDYSHPKVDWDEFYVGLNAGEIFGDSNKVTESAANRVGNFHTDGLAGGGEIGFNAHYGHWMLGIEADVSGSGAQGSRTCVNPAYTCYTEQHWFVSLRPRLGWAIGNFIPYVTAGIGYGDITSYRNSTSLGITNDNLTSNAEAGYIAGFGGTLMFDKNWSAKIEYLYTDYQDSHVLNDAQTSTSSILLHTSQVRAGVDYRFN